MEKKNLMNNKLLNVLNTTNLNLDFLKMEVINFINIFNFWKQTNLTDEQILQFVNNINKSYLNLKNQIISLVKKIEVNDDELQKFIKLNVDQGKKLDELKAEDQEAKKDE